MRPRKIFKPFFLFFIQLLLTVCAKSQFDHNNYTHLTTRDGLSNSEVSAVTQDRFGYIWIGTEQGLNRFDGLNVMHFFAGRDNKSLTDDRISNLQWVDSNLLAVISTVGVTLFNIETLKFTPLLVPAGPLKYEERVNRTRGLLTDENGNYYIITRTGFYHFNPRLELIYRYDDYTLNEFEKDGGSFGIFFGWLDKGNIIVQGQKGVYCYNTKSKSIIQVKQGHRQGKRI